MRKIILIGYMGSGKSTIANLLADKINFSCIELDELIEKKAKKSIKMIFSEKGELYFRKLEHQLLVESIQTEKSFVLSTGGGTSCYFNTMELINHNPCITIYLKASIETLYERLKSQLKDRPLLANLEVIELKEFIAKHLFERSFFYNQAHYTISVDGKTKNEIVEEINTLLF